MKRVNQNSMIKCHLDDATLATMEPVISQKNEGARKKPAVAKSPVKQVAAKTRPVAAKTGKSSKAKTAKVSAFGAVGAVKAATKPKSASAKSASKKDARPAAMKKPVKPDDLKLISGVGPKLEGVLNGLGIYQFKQVASWKKAERDWVDGYLNFKGRIERDDWVRQAKALAKGGVEEYIKVFGKKPR